MADRDTELLRTRLEIQRLNKLVTNIHVKSDNAPDGGSKIQQHRRRNVELEKEVDNLKWQLNAVSSIILIGPSLVNSPAIYIPLLYKYLLG